jgi:pimeloyl-ACP methyl ester carboxylesterase
MLLRTISSTVLAGSLGLALASCSPTRGDARQVDAATTAVEPLLEATDRFFTSNGVSIRYRVIGNGTPMLLLHGYTDRLEMWAGTADSLARDFRVIVPDLRGSGLSTKFGDPSQYGRKMMEDLVGLLDELWIREVHLVGYSMGAVIAANMALDDPARVLTATFVAGPFYADSAAAARDFEQYAVAQERGEGITPFFKWILPTWSDSAVATIVPQLEAMNDSASLVASLRAIPALTPDLARVTRATTPAVAIVSVKDRLWPNSRFIAERWPGARLVELPNGDHADIFLAPEVISEVRRIAMRR